MKNVVTTVEREVVLGQALEWAERFKWEIPDDDLSQSMEAVK